MNEIDAELRALLAIEPSPEFAARVRERVSNERMTGSSWRFAGTWAAAAATVFVTIGFALWPSTELPTAPAAPTAQVAVRTVPPAPGPLPAPAPPSRNIAAAESRVAMTSPRRVASPADPEVMVDARQTAAINRLFDMVRAGTALEPPTHGSPDAPIIVEPLRIPDLTIVDRAGTSSLTNKLAPDEISQPRSRS